MAGRNDNPPPPEDRLPENLADGLLGVETHSFHLSSLDAATQQQLRVRCPQCLDHIPVSVRDRLVRLCCPTCGYEFGLADPDTEDPPAPLGHFQFLECLGMGGFGTVWKALDAQLGRHVAIKLPRQGKLAAVDVQRFMEEARVVAQLNHPGIVSVHEIGRDGDRVFIVSDLIEGQPLTKKISEGGLPWREAAELCVSIADALGHAHALGIVHRDLKPPNILLDESGRPHITDFGLAKHVSRDVTVTADGHVLGTPAYMSPEQAEGRTRDTDARSDVYSLGVILFELLTGERPFRGDIAMLLKSVSHDLPPRPRSLRSSIPRDMEIICLKCLEKSREHRYANATELAQDLRRLLAGETILARPTSAWEQLRRWCWRNPFLAGLIVTTLAMSCLTTAGAISIASVRQGDISAAVAELSAYRRSEAPELLAIERMVAEASRRLATGRLDQGPGDRLEPFLQELFNRHRHASDLPDHGVLSWFWQDASGRLIAIWPNDQRVIGHDFSGRDYFRGARRAAGKTYISEPFHSQNDGLYKIAVSQAVLADSGELAGVLSVSVANEASYAIHRQERLVSLLQWWAGATMLPWLAFFGLNIALALLRRRTIGTSGSAVTVRVS